MKLEQRAPSRDYFIEKGSITRNMYFEFINDISVIYRLKDKVISNICLLHLFDRNRSKSIQPDKYIACTLHRVLILAFGPEKKYIHVY